MKKIIVTGALGHIGSALIRALPDAFGCEIIMIDNLLTQRYCSLFNLPKNGHYTFIEADIMNADLTQMFEGADAVIHLAAITNAARSFDKAQEVEEVNFVGTQKVVDACMRVGAKFIFLSTTSVYGTQNDVVDEACSKEELQPQSPYAESKFKSEEYLKTLKEKLDYIILRFGTIAGYSVGMRFHTAVNKFCWQAVMNEPVTVWKTAYHQKRPYLDLVDAINALVYILKNDLFDGEVYNILTQNCTVSEIVEMIKEEVQTIRVNFVETKIMNQLSYNVANEKFKKLGFVYTGNLRHSIKETVNTLRSANSGA